MSCESELAVIVAAFVTKVLLPAFKVKGLEPPDDIVPAPAKPSAVSDTDIVSIEATPVKAPPVVTLSPVDVNEKVPDALPMAVFPETEERVVLPQDVKSVKIAVPGAEVPIDTRFAAPVAEIFQLLSVKERLAEVFPMFRFPAYEPVPIFMLSDPVVLTLTAPAILAPPVAVKRPPKVTLSQSVPVVRVDVALSRLQYPTVPVVAPVIFPLHVRFPVAPSTVHPVCVDPPARFTEVALLPPGPRFIVVAVPSALTVATLLLNRFSVPVADVPSV